jgi:pimeloyl-ACP methyl ester carboxylesterase
MPSFMRTLLRPLLTSLLAVAVAASSAGCAPEGDLVVLQRAGARMPVWVRGNTASGTYVLFLHGGPGSSAFMKFNQPFFQELEKRYAVVYWEQRCSGSSQGPVDCTQVTMEDFLEDTTQFVDLVHARYAPERVVLMGHSWGGLLGPLWLADAAHQAKVDQWIEIDGAHNVPLGVELARKWMLARAEQKLARGEDTAFWTEVKSFYEAHAVIGDAEFHQHIAYVHKGGGYVHGQKKNSASVFDYLGTPNDLPRKSYQEATFPRVFHFLHFDATPGMKNITLPSLILWGRHDGTLPAELAQHAAESLGTAPEQKRVVIFEQSGHSPFEEEPEAVLESVTSFIDGPAL